MLEGYRAQLLRQEGYPARMAAERTPDTAASRPLSAYAGSDSNPVNGTVRIRLEGDRLEAEAGGERTPLSHWHYDAFIAATDHFMGVWNNDGWRRRLAFVTNPQGQVSELTISGKPGAAFARKPE